MAEFSDFEEPDSIPVLEVRVLDAAKKTSYRVRRLTNFPTAETVDDMKKGLKMFMPDIKPTYNWKIGYILDRNKKYTIETDGELLEAWGHFQRGYQMWLDPSPAKVVVAKNRTSTNAQGIISIGNHTGRSAIND